MPKGEIRVVHVPRWITIALWIVLTAAMAFAVYSLSGKAYAREPNLSLIDALRQARTSTSMLAAIAPALADMLFFVPWGALTFLAFDSHSRKLTYAVTMALGVAFALGLVAWEQILPTRISRIPDAAWNVAGCAAGAVLAHARKRVRVRFE